MEIRKSLNLLKHVARVLLSDGHFPTPAFSMLKQLLDGAPISPGELLGDTLEMPDRDNCRVFEMTETADSGASLPHAVRRRPFDE